MRSFVRFIIVSVVLTALAFFCEGLKANFFTESDSETVSCTSNGSLTDPFQSEHSFIKYNTVCLTSPIGDGQTVTRTTSSASGSMCRHSRRPDFGFKTLEFMIQNGPAIQKKSLPTLRKLRL